MCPDKQTKQYAVIGKIHFSSSVDYDYLTRGDFFCFFFILQVHNVSFAFELMQDGGLKKPKARPEGSPFKHTSTEPNIPLAGWDWEKTVCMFQSFVASSCNGVLLPSWLLF